MNTQKSTIDDLVNFYGLKKNEKIEKLKNEKFLTQHKFFDWFYGGIHEYFWNQIYVNERLTNKEQIQEDKKLNMPLSKKEYSESLIAAVYNKIDFYEYYTESNTKITGELIEAWELKEEIKIVLDEYISNKPEFKEAIKKYGTDELNQEDRENLVTIGLLYEYLGQKVPDKIKLTIGEALYKWHMGYYTQPMNYVKDERGFITRRKGKFPNESEEITDEDRYYSSVNGEPWDELEPRINEAKKIVEKFKLKNKDFNTNIQYNEAIRPISEYDKIAEPIIGSESMY